METHSSKKGFSCPSFYLQVPRCFCQGVRERLGDRTDLPTCDLGLPNPSIKDVCVQEREKGREREWLPECLEVGKEFRHKLVWPVVPGASRKLTHTNPHKSTPP